jgi:hypothetical protein
MLSRLYRDRLAERSLLDEQDELTLARAESPLERFEMSVELSDLQRDLAEATNASWLRNPAQDLSLKASLYTSPLRAAERRR